jgi:hypothetical protein
MRSKNKPRQTAAESRHAAVIAGMDCIVCGQGGPSEVHEPEQGMWWIAIPLCSECHRGRNGWHGDRLRWKLRKVSELSAINQTIEAVCAG